VGVGVFVAVGFVVGVLVEVAVGLAVSVWAIAFSMSAWDGPHAEINRAERIKVVIVKTFFCSFSLPATCRGHITFNLDCHFLPSWLIEYPFYKVL